MTSSIMGPAVLKDGREEAIYAVCPNVTVPKLHCRGDGGVCLLRHERRGTTVLEECLKNQSTMHPVLARSIAGAMELGYVTFSLCPKTVSVARRGNHLYFPPNPP